MANMIYVTIKGETQGLISQGCSTLDSIGNRYQNGHENRIMVLQFNHGLTVAQNVNYQPVNFIKPLDKSSPLLMIAAANREKMELTFDVYRTSQIGSQELFYSILLTGAKICGLNVNYPHVVNDNKGQPEEVVSVQYVNITCRHYMAGTSGYCIWDEMVY
ncbi:Hcp family type VI secretion system effector [Photorhabdus tasmaniensis]|uniref:Type VI secretion system tube protein Hcp n=1 Tax=Photorhabdus tasmaniensis TaxID=1004159 RepID=A0ABX0GI20_9GAMM|nr:Hcp family type VI secretion system effector [Photorhabdus tasmaniensis]NHB88818.1 type VI secretion system tube protein Hcp [Photorhabdus tasmaniensis]